MSTIINTPGNTNTSDDSSGWAVAVIILLVVLGIGAYFLMGYRAPAGTPTDTNINVTLPNPPVTSTEGNTSNPQ